MAAICYVPNAIAEEILLTQLTAYALPDRFDAYKRTTAGLIDTVAPDDPRIYSRLEQLTARTLILTGR
jgi:hypothetical protein